MEPGNECGVAGGGGSTLKVTMTFVSRSVLGRKGARWLEGPRGKRLAGNRGGAPGRCIVRARAREWSGAEVEPRGLVRCSPSRVFWGRCTRNDTRSKTKLPCSCELVGVRGFKSASGSVPGPPSARGAALFAQLRRDAAATMRATRGRSEAALAPRRLFPCGPRPSRAGVGRAAESQLEFAVPSPVA